MNSISLGRADAARSHTQSHNPRSPWPFARARAQGGWGHAWEPSSQRLSPALRFSARPEHAACAVDPLI
eukprot:13690298-Alexandrium_andersonii.AAC.1